MKLKKILAVVSALCMICAVMPFSEKYIPGTAISASAEEYTEGTYENLTYEKYADYVEISGVTDKEITEAVIPAEIDGLPVTSIGGHAFYWCSGLTSVTIPESVTSIGDYAFYRCESLTSVTIPDSVTSIGSQAFFYCSGLTSVTIPDSVTSIGWATFSDCSSLTSVTIPKNVTSIEDSAFSHCSSLTSVTIPKNVTSIEDSAFSHCSSLTSVTIPESVTSIGSSAFYGTPWLETKQEENPLVIINDILIDGKTCEGDITIPDSVTSIVGDAFLDCSLTSVTIPESVTSIGSQAFLGCSELTSVIIENPDCEIYDSSYTISNEFDVLNSHYNGTIYGYENSTAQAYAEKYGYTFEVLGSAPETTEPTETETSAPAVPAEDMVWNGVNPDINRDGTIDAADSAVLLTYAAEFGAGKVTSFKEFMDKYYS